MSQYKVPTLAEVQADLPAATEQDKFNVLLNQPPPKSWIKKNKFVKIKDENGNMVSAEYLPIDKVEYLLLKIFGKWRREIKDIKVAGNSIMATVRVWVWHPIKLDWDWHDGVGAVSIQTDSGAGNDAEAMKKDAFQKGAPAAVSYAVKDAAECFGKIFGKDLNKANTIQFSAVYSWDAVTVEEPIINLNGLPAPEVTENF